MKILLIFIMDPMDGTAESAFLLEEPCWKKVQHLLS